MANINVKDGIVMEGNIVPNSDNTRDLGSSTNAWSDVYTQNLSVKTGVDTDLIPNADGVRRLGNQNNKWLNVNTQSLSVSTINGRNYNSDGTKLDGIQAGARTNQQINAGNALTGGGNSDTVTINHGDTSSQASVYNSLGNVIQDIVLDTYGHITNINTVDLDSRYVKPGDINLANSAITINAGSGLSGGGVFRVNQSFDETITVTHADTSSQGDVNNSGGRVIQDIYVDTYGHITNINSTDLDSRFAALSGSLSQNFSVDRLTINNREKNTLSTDGQMGFDSSQGLIIYRTQGTTGAVTVLDGANVTAGGGIDITNLGTGGTGTQTFTFSHTDTSSQSSVNNSGGTVIQDITLDTYGHITNINSSNLDSRYYTESESDSRFLRSDTGDTMSGNLTVTGTISVGTNGGGDSLVRFYDDNSDTYRTLKWDNSDNEWQVEDNNGVVRTLFHGGNLPSIGVTAVGAYIYGYTDQVKTLGQTVSGSNLWRAGWNLTFATPSSPVGQAVSGFFPNIQGTVSGTWMCCGDAQHQGSANSAITVWRRIS